MFNRVPLERIFDNPFQTRSVYTEIEELAQSIFKMRAARPETSGLIQVPPARILVAVKGMSGGANPRLIQGRMDKFAVLDPQEYGGVESCLSDEPLAFVQLAAGHRRFRAFAHLALSQAEYGTFPIDVLILDNQQMADLAWEENAKRKDLTAIEEAEALAKAIELFNYTQAQIGERWGLSQSAVANKLRLMGLPEEAKEAIRQGQITEKHGRALLSAWQKSPAIYEAAAADILPSEAKDGVEEKAKEIFSKGDKVGRWYGMQSEPRHTEVQRLDCEACGQRVYEANRFLQPYYLANKGIRTEGELPFFVLCSPCYRVASGWVVPSTAAAADIVQRVINQSSARMVHVKWPMDRTFEVPVEGKAMRKVLPACEGCKTREERDKEPFCLDKGCFDLKGKLWQEQQFAAVRARLEADWGEAGKSVEIVEGYTGEDLSVRGVDPELVKNGVCVPGKCKRLRVKYQTYKDDNELYPYGDLPFVWNCNNSNSHSACQRKYLASQQPEGEKSAERIKAEMADANKKQGKKLIDQAKVEISQALAQGEFKAWQQLVQRVAYNKVEKLESVEECYAVLGGELVSSVARELGYGDWEDGERLTRFKVRLNERLRELGIDGAIISQEMVEA